jgi:hypothetical protein
MAPPVLGPRELNRALLERQLLLRRADRPVAETVEHLLGLQAQAPLPPFLGLWSRVRGFDPHELGRMLTRARGRGADADARDRAPRHAAARGLAQGRRAPYATLEALDRAGAG